MTSPSCVWMNRGSLVSSPALSDRGFCFGQRVMTTMLAVNSKILDFDRHIQRLSDHAEKMGLPIDVRGDDILFELEAALAIHRPARAACRVYLTAGSGGAKSAVVECQRWSQVESLEAEIFASEAVKLELQVDAFWRRGEHLKTGLYAEALPLLSRKAEKGFTDILWCNGDQEIAECTTSNIFLIGREGDLVEIATPPVASGLLLGVTRRRIMELLNAAKIPVTERIIYKDELPRFDEGFVTSSLSGIVPVSQIGKHRLHSDRPTAVTGHVKRLWRAWCDTF